MAAELQFQEDTLRETMTALGEAARGAAVLLAQTSPEAKNRALEAAAEAIRDAEGRILEANALDMAAARTKAEETLKDEEILGCAPKQCR